MSDMTYFTLANGMIAELLEDDHAKRQEKNYLALRNGSIKINPGKWFQPAAYSKYFPFIYNFDFRSSDISVITHPKAGTHWMLEIVWNLIHNSKLDNPEALKSFEMRCADVTGTAYLSQMGEIIKSYKVPQAANEIDDGENYDSEDFLKKMQVINEEMPNPRVLKMHHPFELLPEGFLDQRKVIYVARNPFDICNSTYHFCRLNILVGFEGTLDDFIDDFIAGRWAFGPYFKHMKQAWDLREHPNMLFLFYEDLIFDIGKEMRKIVEFLEVNRTDEEIRNVSNFITFDSLKERFISNPPTSYNLQFFDKKLMEKQGGFFRKGKLNDWKNYFNTEQYKKLEDFSKENLKMFGEDFKYNQNYI